MFVVHDNNPLYQDNWVKEHNIPIFLDTFFPSTADLIQNICYYIPNFEKEVEEGNNYE